MRDTMRAVTAAAVLLLAASGVHAVPESALERAARLREESTADWRAGRYREAAEKLRTADEILAAAEGDRREDRAVVLRAIAWNLSQAGDAEGARAAWRKLAELVKGAERWEHEVMSAYAALYQAARKFDDPIGWLAEVREAAEELGYPRIVGQSWHDAGFLHFEYKEYEASRQAYAKAIELRNRSGDELGLAWSGTNLANVELTDGRLAESLAPLEAAMRLIRRSPRPVPQPQVALAVNLRDAVERIRGAESEEKERKWLWTAAGIASSTAPEIVPADFLFRAALEVDPGPESAARLVAAELPGRPPEVKADLVLRAARAVLDAGDPKKALAWLESVEVGEGPASPHLAARRDLGLALAVAALEDRPRFAIQAKAAAARWRDLGDHAGRLNAMAALIVAATDLGVREELADVVAENEELQRAGRPGGAGGAASAGGRTGDVSNMGEHDRLFTIGLEEGRVVIRDLLVSKEWAFDVAWRPRNVTANGMALRLFGGYVQIQSFHYGGASIATGAPGSITLDQMGEYRPLPATGHLTVLRNGATRYEP